MLKLVGKNYQFPLANAAAFGRLCVETEQLQSITKKLDAAAFGRLCVETVGWWCQSNGEEAAAFGRLCVETHH